MQLLVVEGASTAYGMDASDYGGWAHQLHRDQQKYNTQHRRDPRVMLNRSFPGATLPYFNKYAEPNVGSFARAGNNGVVRILSVGMNEAKIMPGNERPILSLAKFATELALYSASSHAFGVTATVYVGPQPVDEARTTPIESTGCTIEDDLLQEYDALIKERAEDDRMPYVDVRGLFGQGTLNDLLAEDGYHPNATGHSVIYSGVRAALAQLSLFQS